MLGKDGKPFIVGSPWSIVGSSNSDQKGESNILWHNDTTNETKIWFINGFQVTDQQTVLNKDGKPFIVGAPWSIVGTGVFFKDDGIR